MPLKPQKITTEADLLINLLKESKEISVDDASKALGVPVATLEKWAAFLEEERVISIKYKLTTPYLVYNSPSFSSRKVAAEAFDKHSLQAPDLEESIKKIDDLFSKAEDETKRGDFISIKGTMPQLLNQAKLFKDKVQLGTDKKDNVEKIISKVEAALLQASTFVDQGKFDVANNLYSEVQREMKDLLLSLKQEYKQLEQAKSEAPTHAATAEVSDLKIVLDKAYSLLKEGKLEQSRTIYDQLKRRHERLPIEFAQKKMEIEGSLVKLNKDLSASLDRKNSELMREGVKKIQGLMKVSKDSAARGDFPKAEQSYSEITQIFCSLPGGFLKEQKIMEKQVLELFEFVSSKRKEILSKSVMEKHSTCTSLSKSVQQSIDAGNVKEATASYNEAKRVYDAIPVEFLKEKLAVQEMLMPLFRNLSQLYAQKSTSKVADKDKIIRQLADEMKKQVDALELTSSEETYAKINSEFKDFPPGFIKERIDLQNLALSVYEYYLSRSGDFMSKAAQVKHMMIDLLLREGQDYVKRKDYDLAEEIYNEAVAAYNALPEGFAYDKAALRQKMLELYRQVMVNMDFNILKTNSPEVNSRYHEILKVLLSSQHNITSKRFDLLESDFHTMRKIYNELPVGFVQEKLKLRDNVAEVGLAVEFYRKTMQLEQAKITGQDSRQISEQISAMRSKMDNSLRPLIDFHDEKLRALNLPKPAIQAAPKPEPLKVPAQANPIVQIAKPAIQSVQGAQVASQAPQKPSPKITVPSKPFVNLRPRLFLFPKPTTQKRETAEKEKKIEELQKGMQDIVARISALRKQAAAENARMPA